MNNKIEKIILPVSDMTCKACENKINKSLLKTEGITEVLASYEKSKVSIEYNPQVINQESIVKSINKLGYTVKDEKYSFKSIIYVLIALFGVYIIADALNILDIFYNIPVLEAGSGYVAVFFIGIFTSVHCIAMCGGINLTQSTMNKNDLASTKPNYKSNLQYNIGRIISYTLIGGLLGGLGSVFTISSSFQTLIMVLAGIFMVIMGINMLGIFPGLRALNLSLPNSITSKISSLKNGKGPLYIGLLNGFMPCGPLQAIQLFALSTGSFVSGALTMLFFALGTLPLVFGFGIVASLLNQKFARRVNLVSAVLIAVLGLFMVQNSFALSGNTFKQETTASQINIVMEDGKQVVTSKVGTRSYEKIVVQSGIPVKLIFEADKGVINGCNNEIVIPQLGIQKKLTEGDNVIEFTPTESGTISFSCWMGMIRSSITVVDNVENFVPQIEEALFPWSFGGGGCCG